MRFTPSTAKSMNSWASVSSWSAVAAFEQLHVAGDHPQRLGEVVRGDVRELRQVGVRTLQLDRTLLQLGGDPGEALLRSLALA